MIFCKFLTAKFMFSKLTKIQPVRKIILLRTGCIFGQFCKLKVIALLLLYLSQNTFLIMICVGIYAVLVEGISTSGDNISAAIWGCMGYTVLLCYTLFKTGSLAKSLFGAH